MAFIRKRTGRWNGGTAVYYQLVETYRENGKVKQRVAGLGVHPTVEEALHALRARVARIEALLVREPQGWRAWRRRKKTAAELTECLDRARDRLMKLEGVVSRISRRRDTLDTTPEASGIAPAK
jgi:hypothetical protein